MDLPANGFELLDRLRDNQAKKDLRFRKLKDYFGLKAREKGVPIFGEFELTPLCNFDCKMCYVHLTPDQLNGHPVLPADTWKDLMRQAWEAGMMFANLSGGECLAYPGFEDLFLYLHSLGVGVGVLTNGFLLDEERVRFFTDHMPSSIQITLYGWNDDVYERVTGRRAFTTVASHIRLAVEANLPVCISITPNHFLGEDILETIRVARELCKTVMINSSYTTPREETGRSGIQGDADTALYIRAYQYSDELDGKETIEIRDELLPPCGGPVHESSGCGLLCGGGRSDFAIDWKGMMKPCVDMELIHAYPLQTGFAAAWAKVNREANEWPRVPECKGCAYNGVCNNCAAIMLQYAAPGEQPTGLCKKTREMVCHGVRHLPECE